MHWKNSEQAYGWVAKTLHWLTALFVLVLYPLGLWMVGMDYYDPWYHDAPLIHKTLGVSLALLLLCRLYWRWYSPPPQPLGRPWERRVAHWVHRALYLLLLLLPVTGYLISTAEGHPLELWGGWQIPAIGPFVDNQEDIAGLLHEWLAHALVALVVLHALAALKHHFLDGDDTLRRMTRMGVDAIPTTQHVSQKETTT